MVVAMTAPVDEARQFVELRRTRRRFGVSADYNDRDLGEFVGAMLIRLQTEPGDTPAGRVSLHLETPQGVLVVPVGGWVTRTGERFGVALLPDFEGGP